MHKFTTVEESKQKSASRPGSKVEKEGDQVVPPGSDDDTNKNESQKSQFLDSMLSMMHDIEEEASKDKKNASPSDQLSGEYFEIYKKTTTEKTEMIKRLKKGDKQPQTKRMSQKQQKPEKEKEPPPKPRAEKKESSDESQSPKSSKSSKESKPNYLEQLFELTKQKNEKFKTPTEPIVKSKQPA